jgi:hypothetical protein
MFGKKKSKSNSKDEQHSSHYSLRLERKKKNSSQANNYSAEYLCKNSSSSESLDNLISSYKLKGRKGYSLDRNTESFDVEQKPQSKPKRSSWFLRDKSRDKQSKKEKFLKRSSLDFTVAYDTKQHEKPRTKTKTIQRQNAADYTGDSSTTPQEEIPEPKKSGLSKFQIGKRFLKGEIGIRSFNYYLLKEGLKKGKQKSEPVSTKPTYKSKSEENIYEEIYFYHDQPTPKPKTPPALPPFNKQTSVPLKQKQAFTVDEGNCMNCEICVQEAQQEKNSLCMLKNCDKCDESHHLQRPMRNSLSGSEGYAHVTKKISEQTIYDFFQQQQQGQTVLQFQSYNPSNPNVYKIETTPVAFEYKPIDEQIYQLNQHYARVQQPPQHYSGDGKIMPKSSSSSDSIKGQNQRHRQSQQQSNEFYTRPNYFYPSSDNNKQQQQQQQSKKDQMYKTDSSNSIRSENSLNKIYNSKNSSQKSNHSNKSANRDETQLRDMSDSSLGDSLFSSDANKRYFGSSESCRFNYESCRRRCSLENEKCSFSDTCRYECNLRNCDCSSSYFSSDFDDTNIYNNTNSNRMMKSHHSNNNNNNQQQPLEYPQIYDQKTNRYAEDFIKHVSNVKRRSQNAALEGANVLINTQQMMGTSIYEVPKLNPKRLDVEQARTVENDNNQNNNKMPVGDLEENLLMHVDDKTSLSKNHVKATGTVPKLSSSISSNESKKKSGQRHKENKQKQSTFNEPIKNESETLMIAKDEKITMNEKILSVEVLSDLQNVLEASDTTVKEKPKSDMSKSLDTDRQSKNEQQKNIDIVDDDDDDVFLENRQKVSLIMFSEIMMK